MTNLDSIKKQVAECTSEQFARLPYIFGKSCPPPYDEDDECPKTNVDYDKTPDPCIACWKEWLEQEEGA